MRRKLTEPEKKRVAAAQLWRCAACDDVLPAAYQIDHKVPLADGGRDHVDNAQALCPNCHADKTQREAIERHAAAAAVYSEREDVRRGEQWVCTTCFRRRPVTSPWEAHVCLVVDNAATLAMFAHTAK